MCLLCNPLKVGMSSTCMPNYRGISYCICEAYVQRLTCKLLDKWQGCWRVFPIHSCSESLNNLVNFGKLGICWSLLSISLLYEKNRFYLAEKKNHKLNHQISIILMLSPGPGLWSRSRWSRMFSAGVGVGFQNCWSRSRFFKTAGVGVGSWSQFFKTAGVGTFVAITDSNVY